MKKMKAMLVIMLAAGVVMTGCSQTTSKDTSSVYETVDGGESTSGTEETGDVVTGSLTSTTADAANEETVTEEASGDYFSNRDLEQEADLSEATYIEVVDGEDITISEEGVYVLSGNAAEVTVTVDAENAKVQIVLDGVTITNTDAPAIYVKNADKVFVTTTDSDNTLSVTGTYVADGDTNLDAVIFAKDDLTLNGLGTLTISSSEGNGISGKDEVTITGGTYNITCSEDAIEAHDSIAIADGSFTINCGKDAFHAEDSDDDTVGFIYISGGTFDLEAGDDGIQATTTLTIDGGTFDISAVEGLEATYITINDGTFNISASDDGINAASKSTACDVVIEINGGYITIVMGSGDTDAVDANGSIYVNGGTLDITANSAFDYDYTAEFNGGTIIINGQEVSEIPASMMGGMGGMGGPMGGNQGGQMGGGPGGQMGGGPGGNGGQTVM